MQKIEIKKRTPEETAAYIAGYQAGQKNAPGSQIIVLKTSQLLHPKDYEHLIDDLTQQAQAGLLLLGQSLEYCGAVAADSDIKLVIQEQGGDHETDQNNCN